MTLNLEQEIQAIRDSIGIPGPVTATGAVPVPIVGGPAVGDEAVLEAMETGSSSSGDQSMFSGSGGPMEISG